MRRQKYRQARLRRLAILFFIVGLSLLLLPTVAGLGRKHSDELAVNRYQQKKAAASLATRLHRYNRALAAGRTPAAAPVATALSGTLGYLSIPSIHIAKAPIYYGADDATLARGIGLLPHTSLPIGGKNTLSVLSGHSGFENQIIFDNIRHLKNGDYFYLTTFGQPRRAYRVYQRKIVTPAGADAAAAIKIQPGQDITVLLTCTPLFINSHRLLIYGKRVPLKTAAAMPVAVRDQWGFAHLLLLLAAVVLLIALLVIIGHLTQARRERRSRQRRGPRPEA
ncbi:class C sortase [Lacticaseibacillus salsurivasis]|uniref:class C sortase n=1 Tax=Lacticaseibacillus salsurivasis TaxID=3081441 RepID=UPI0030C73B9C